MNMKARFIHNVIPAGADIDNPDLEMHDEEHHRLYNILVNDLRKRAQLRGPKYMAWLRRHAFKKGTEVEILDIYNQADTAHLYNTPTPPRIVVAVRGENWDGEIVESQVGIEDLDISALFPESDKMRPEDWMAAFAEWQARRGTQ